MNINEKLVSITKVIGIKTATSNTLETDPQTARIPELWQRFFSENIEDQIPNKINNGLLYGVYSNYDSEHRGHFSITAGQQVSTTKIIPEGFVALEIPQDNYLVFADEGDMPTLIYSLWQSIRDYFAQSTNYMRAFTTDFELYNKENTNKIEIYVAIKK